MKVTDNRVAGSNRGIDQFGGRSGPIACPVPESMEGEREHDARGLIIALLLCMTCWAALGYFLLT